MIVLVYKFNIIYVVFLVIEIRYVYEGNWFYVCYFVINNFIYLKYMIFYFIVIYNINDVYISE